MIAACIAFAVMVLGLTTWLMSSYRGELGDTLITMGEKLTGTLPSPTEEHPDANAPDTASPNASPSTSADSSGVARTSTPPGTNSTARPAIGGVPPVVNSTPGGTAQANGASGDTGAMELGVAMQFLHGANGKSQPMQAVEWLWLSVEKGNMPAEVALADLYVRGEGVAQSCEEARVLLLAASKKGSGEATRALGDLPTKGCPAAAPAGAASSSSANPGDRSGAVAPERPLAPPAGAPASGTSTTEPAGNTPRAPQR